MKFEYLWSNFTSAPTSEELDTFGEDRWELVSVVHVPSINRWHCYFKREAGSLRLDGTRS